MIKHGLKTFKPKMAQIPHSLRLIPQVPWTIVYHSLAEFIDFGKEDVTGWQHVENQGWGAHYYVYPSGTIVESIKPGYMGAHAKGFNENTVGIEIIVPGVLTYQTFTQKILNERWYKLAQVTSVINLSNWLIESTGTIKYATTHSYLDPDRKVDPGNFKYDQLKTFIKLESENMNF